MPIRCGASISVLLWAMRRPNTCRNAHCNSNFEPLHQQMSAGCERYILTAIFCDLVVLNLCQMAPLMCETYSRALRQQTSKLLTVMPMKSAWTVDNATGIVSRILNLPATILDLLDGYKSITVGLGLLTPPQQTARWLTTIWRGVRL